MSLPQIAPYPLPAAQDIPVARAPWRLEKHRAALLVHDMQGYFTRRFPAAEPPLPQATGNIALLSEACRSAGVPVFYTAQPGNQDPRDRGLQRDLWGPGMTESEEDQAIIEPLTPKPGDQVLVKWRYSAFQRTNLADLLRVRNRDQLLITGIYAHIGCQTTAVDAFMHDIEPFFVADALADFSAELHELAVEYVASRCGVALTTAQAMEVLA